MTKNVRLTQYSHGAGCGCKIAPATLQEILSHSTIDFFSPQLWVGHESRDDAAVMDLGDGTGIISTTDFFMPIVDDPFTFGRIAATNALSDIYAMGGTPMMAIAILDGPFKSSPRSRRPSHRWWSISCRDAGIPWLAGTVSISGAHLWIGCHRASLEEHLKKTGGSERRYSLPYEAPNGILATALSVDCSQLRMKT